MRPNQALKQPVALASACCSAVMAPAAERQLVRRRHYSPRGPAFRSSPERGWRHDGKRSSVGGAEQITITQSPARRHRRRSPRRPPAGPLDRGPPAWSAADRSRGAAGAADQPDRPGNGPEPAGTLASETRDDRAVRGAPPNPPAGASASPLGGAPRGTGRCARLDRRPPPPACP